ncbi:porin [Blastopirellula sp. JC732]|uniref:Porin n=1 Tax=Blastopirellula sediminis TaxID=2894196 RepID=A0A9X1SGD9_9BACT|nr:DcaP family trimeric outer membrane transporter [Blastopirellula sediminis]MCC9608637.1 porin [Blastopirellula sediminis]MCC9628586.1 porin [Blastopirellula sediminis]
MHRQIISGLVHWAPAMLTCCLAIAPATLRAQTIYSAPPAEHAYANGEFRTGLVAARVDNAGLQPPSPPPIPQDDLIRRIQELEANQRRLEQMLAVPNDQNSPAASETLPEPIPQYFYAPSYYDAIDVGARPIADYAPPGYMPREQQDGPGVPEFTPIVPPTFEPTPQEFVERGMFPGSFLVPGTNTSMRLRGFVRLATLYDFEPINTADAFVTNAIPVPQQSGQNFNMSARHSRFALESWTPTSFSDWNVHTLIEADFFNGPAQAAGGGGNLLRLRHAFIDFGVFRFGQQNTVFMDPSAWPSVVDFRGPNSRPNQRQPALRMTLPLGCNGLYWAGSMERCFSDITTNGLGTGVQDMPDFATHLRYEADRGHLQLSGLFRQIGYRPTGGDVQHESAAGISGAAVFHPWAILFGTDPVHEQDPSGLTRSRILLQGTWGSGVGRYISDLTNLGLDAQVDPATGTLELVEVSGMNASYEHWFNEHWLSNITFANVNVINAPGQAANTYDSAKYVAGSLWWIPIQRLSFAIEYVYGERENLDGESAQARRLHGLVQYNF